MMFQEALILREIIKSSTVDENTMYQLQMPGEDSNMMEDRKDITMPATRREVQTLLPIAS